MGSWKNCRFEHIKTKTLTHQFDARSIAAIEAALGARRPLLVRGEPGVGKSQLARAAAHALERPLVSQVVTARTESEDLHYRFDAVARLGQAQVLALSQRAGASQPLDALSAEKFVQPGPLWWVFDWAHAERQHKAASLKGTRPAEPDPTWKWHAERGSVLLIDEIDKADPDLPNGLLESLGNGEFHVPYLDEPVRSNPAQEPPLVIITTNEERELPAAFVRRCLVLQISLPKGRELEDFLVARGHAHFEQLSERLRREVAEKLVHEREQDDPDALVKPGQAEYLDLLRAIDEVAGHDVERQQQCLRDIAGFALNKNAPSI